MRSVFYIHCPCIIGIFSLYRLHRKLWVLVSLSCHKMNRIYNWTIRHFRLDSQFKSINALYIVPYPRVGAYMAGFWTGWYLSEIDRKWNVSKVIELEVFSKKRVLNWMIFSTDQSKIGLVPHHMHNNIPCLRSALQKAESLNWRHICCLG